MALTNEDLSKILQSQIALLKQDINDIKVQTMKGFEELKKEVGSLRQGVTDLRRDVDALRQDVTDLRQDVDALRQEVTDLRQDMDALRQDVTDLRQDMDVLRQEMDAVKWDVKNIHLQLENDVMPRLNTIEACYTSTYRRYAGGVEQIEAMQRDIDLLKRSVAEHSEKLKMLA